MKKKLLSVLLCTAMVASLAVGCGGKDETPAEEAPATEEAADAAETAEAAEVEETGELTLYYSHSTDWADPIIEEFENQTGIEVSLVQDGTSSLFARVKAEAANPQADVIWGGVVDTYRANENLLQPYTTTEADALKADAKDAHGYYMGFDMGPMVMIYNTDLVDAADAPTKWADLLDEKYFGQIATADPTSSSSAFACMMSIIQAYGTEDGKGYEFLEKLVDNLDGKIIESSSGVIKGVANGEYMIGLTYEEGALRYMDSDAAVAIVYPEEGTSASPSGVGIVKDCKNLKSAQMFIDYIASEEVQSQLGALNRRSVRTDVADPETMQAWDTISFVEMDIDWTSSHTEEFNETWLDYVTK